MLLLVTIQTQEFPVAAIRGVVVVIVIPVMDRELANVFAAELARALRAHGRKQFQRAGPIAAKTVSAGPPRAGYEIM